MSELTGKQKRYLRSLGQHLSAMSVIGKEGLSEAVVATLGRLLDQHELIKVRLHVQDASERDEAAEALSAATGAALAGAIGHTALLYRPNTERSANKRITLPT
ncbi:MAG: ribosome assembly RNA-binding protein YhbY [Phycisphaerae bacterium]|jgi:RNA-binding protein